MPWPGVLLRLRWSITQRVGPGPHSTDGPPARAFIPLPLGDRGCVWGCRGAPDALHHYLRCPAARSDVAGDFPSVHPARPPAAFLGLGVSDQPFEDRSVCIHAFVALCARYHTIRHDPLQEFAMASEEPQPSAQRTVPDVPTIERQTAHLLGRHVNTTSRTGCCASTLAPRCASPFSLTDVGFYVTDAVRTLKSRRASSEVYLVVIGVVVSWGM